MAIGRSFSNFKFSMQSITFCDGPAQPLGATSSTETQISATNRAFWIQPTARYHQTDNALITIAARHIGVYAVAIFEAISTHANFSNGYARPSLEIICEELNISEPTAIKYIAVLEKVKMVEKTTHTFFDKTDGLKTRNSYIVLPSGKWDFSCVIKKLLNVPKENSHELNVVKPNKKQNNKKKINQKEQTTVAPDGGEPAVVVSLNPSSVSGQELDIVEQLENEGVSREVAEELAETAGWEECARQIAWVDARNPKKNRVGLLVKSIRLKYGPPDELEQGECRPAKKTAKQNRQESKPQIHGLAEAEKSSLCTKRISSETPVNTGTSAPDTGIRTDAQRAHTLFLTLPPAEQVELLELARANVSPIWHDRVGAPESPMSLGLWELVRERYPEIL